MDQRKSNRESLATNARRRGRENTEGKKAHRLGAPGIRREPGAIGVSRAAGRCRAARGGRGTSRHRSWARTGPRPGECPGIHQDRQLLGCHQQQQGDKYESGRPFPKA